MRVISATETVTEVEQALEFEHNGDKYRWVGYFNEKVSGYDLYKNGKWLGESDYPDFLDNYDLQELFEENYEAPKND